MADMRDRVKELEAKHARERAAMDLEVAVASAIPSDHRRIFVHQTASLGDVAHVTFGDYFRDEDALSWTRAVELVDLLPAVDVMLCKDSGTSFRPRAHVEGQAKPWRGEKHAVSPVLLGVECTHGPGEQRRPRISLSWWTETSAGRIQVKCEMGHPPPGVLVCVRRPKTGPEWRSDSQWAKDGFSWTKSSTYEVCPSTAMRRIRDPRVDDAEGGPSAASLERINWSHDASDPGSQTFYWTNIGGPFDAAEMARWIVRQLAAAAITPPSASADK